MTTKAESKRMADLQRVGCIACRQLGWFEVPEVHHLLSGNRRRGHLFTIPLCPYHHRGVGAIAGEPSLANGSKPFRARYGTDDVLLAMTNKFLVRPQNGSA